MIADGWARLAARYPGVASQLRNGSALAITQVGEALVRGAYAVLIGIFLGASGYGIWGYVIATYGAVLAAQSLGLETAVEARAGRGDAGAAAFTRTTLGVRLITIAVASALMAVCVPFLEADPLVQAALWLVIPAMVARGIAAWARSLLTARELGFTALKVSLPFRMLELCIGTVLLLAGTNVWALLLLHAGSYIAEAITSILAARRCLPGLRPAIHSAQLRLLLKTGGLLAMTIASIGALNAAPILLSKYAGFSFSGIGNLAIAMQIAALGIFVVQGFMSASFPVLDRAVLRGDRNVEIYGWASLALVSVAAFGAVLFADWMGSTMLTWLLGDGFAAAGDLLPYALLMAAACIAPTGLWQILLVRGYAWVGAVAAVAAILVALAAFTPLAETHGLEGALLASFLGWLVRALILIAATILLKESADQKPT